MPEIGVVAALPKEAATWHARHHRAGHFRVVASGVGARRATQAAENLLADGAGALLSWGVAGGLLASMQPGDLVLADWVAWADGEQTPDPAWREQLAQALGQDGLAVTSGGLWSHPDAVTSVSEKRQLATRNCVAVDMESMAVACVARSAGVPFAAIKSICDPASRALPPDATRLLRDNGRVRASAVANALVRGPAMWRALRVMRSDFNAACISLREAAQMLQLSCPE